MNTCNKLIIESYMFIFGQFGNDGKFLGLLDNILTDLIPGMGYLEDPLDFIGANEFDKCNYSLSNAVVCDSELHSSVKLIGGKLKQLLLLSRKLLTNHHP
jgi:hypothetical protein